MQRMQQFRLDSQTLPVSSGCGNSKAAHFLMLCLASAALSSLLRRAACDFTHYITAGAPAKSAFCLCVAGCRKPRSAEKAAAGSNAVRGDSGEVRGGTAAYSSTSTYFFEVYIRKSAPGAQRRHTSGQLWACSKLSGGASNSSAEVFL